VIYDCVQFHGGAGYLRESHERYVAACGAVQSIGGAHRGDAREVRHAALTVSCGPQGPNDLRKWNDMTTGTVTWFNDTKGFGVITPEDGREDLFSITAHPAAGFKSLT